MRRLSIFTLFFFILPLSLYSSTTFVRDYGGLRHDEGWGCVEVEDGYLIVGTTYSYEDTIGDIFLLKIDRDGNEVLMRRYGLRGYEERGRAIVRSGSGYGIGGVGSGGWGDFYLIRLDSLYNVEWQYWYGGSRSDWLWDMDTTWDGGFVMVGYTNSVGNGGDDLCVIRVDSAGNLLWGNGYGGSSGDYGNWVKTLSSHEFLAAGMYKADGYETWGGYFIKLDSLGDTIFTRTYLDSRIHMDIFSGYYNDVEGFTYVTGWRAILREPDSMNLFCMKLDSLGNTIWMRDYDVPDVKDRGDAIRVVPDGNLLIFGTTNYSYLFPELGGFIRLLKIDTSGNLVWEKIYRFPDRYDGLWLRDGIVTSDGGFLMVGYAWIVGRGDKNIVLIKADSTSYISGLEEVSHSKEIFDHLRIYPNPVRDYLHIDFGIDLLSGSRLELYDITGRKVRVFNVGGRKDFILNLRDLGIKPGVYILLVHTPVGRKSIRFIKE